MLTRGLLILFSLIAIGSCSDHSAFQMEPVADSSSDSAVVLDQLPAIDNNLSRSSMIAGQGIADASNLLVRHGSAGTVNGGLMLNSTIQQSSWAVWGWYGFSSMVFPESIRISMQDDSQAYHILLADFAMKRWRTFGPVNDAVLELNPAQFCDRVLGRDGTFYVAILAADGSRPVVSSVEPLCSNVLEQPAPVLWTTAGYCDSADSIQLNWEAAPLSSEWTILRSRIDDPQDSRTFTADCCSYLDEDVLPGVAYSYRVRAANTHGSADFGPRALGKAGPPLPSGAGELRGRLQYDDAHPAAGVELQIGNGAIISSTDAQGKFSFRGISPGIWNLWKLGNSPRTLLGQYAVASSAMDCGIITLPGTGTPKRGWHWIYPPTGLQVASFSDDALTLSWDEAEKATEYEVYRGRFTDPFWAELQAVTELTSIAMLKQGSGQYYYWVRSREELDGFTRVSSLGKAVSHVFPDKGLQPDTIYAVPDRTEVQAGEEVTFTVVAHQTAHPFNFVNSVRVTFDEGNSYVAGSFNPGSVGGDGGSVDGIWKQVDPEDGFLPLDSDVLGQQPPMNGRCAIDFNVTPIGGHEIDEATGALFNFRLVVNTDVTISFQTSDIVLSTYYSDSSQQQVRTWTHDDNMGMPIVRVVD